MNSSISLNTNSNPNQSQSYNPNTKIVEMVYSLLEMLRLSSPEEMSTKLLLMSQSPQICREMRQYGCLPLLIQLIHQPVSEQVADKEAQVSQQELRDRAAKTFRNIIHNSCKSRREIRVLRLIDDLRSFVDFLRRNGRQLTDDFVDHPNSSVAYLLKVSFDEEHRQIIGLLGGVYAIAEVIQYDYEYHRNAKNNSCVTLRRYSLMALINLTFGDSQTKSLLATQKPFMRALVHNLESPAEELRQVVASLLRNLSWKADYITKQILREVGAVSLLTQAGLEATKESTLKSILSALWNLTAHCAPNKADFCKVEGALPFLISTLTYTSNNNAITIVENGGGILRNISSHIVASDEHREVLRKHNTIQILLEQLKSPSITVVSNSCVTLWNLSARCPKDQTELWELGAVPMLRNLTNSRHKMIAMGASATLKNLFSSPVASNYIRTNGNNSLNSSNSCSIPSLQARKIKALKEDLNCNLSETFDGIESPKVSPSHETYPARRRTSSSTKSNIYLPGRMYTSFSGHINPHQVSRSSSHDSIGSTHSEPPVTKLRDVDHSMRSIYPFVSTQLVPQMYSTMSSTDSRNSTDKELDIGSDFDVYCSESNSQLNISTASVKTSSTSFTDTELDLDPEPTDYSKRYVEPSVDDFRPARSVQSGTGGTKVAPEAVPACEDSVKVYKTEGTPLAFSLASSLSDLRDAGLLTSIDEEKQLANQLTENIDNSIVFKPKSTEEKTKTQFKKPVLPPKPKFSTLPQIKPIPIDENCAISAVNKESAKSVTFVGIDENPLKSSVSTNSIVSFDGAVSNENICAINVEETPLMFSRSSSMGSLSDCEIKSDVCQSSVVSEFSRRTSQVVSPSDLPDSPLDSPSHQPSSPKPMISITVVPTEESQNICDDQKINNKIVDNINNNSTTSETVATEEPTAQPIATTTVFEDRAINFATEGTPAVFSLSTSLSSLNEELNISEICVENDIEVKVENCVEITLNSMEPPLDVNDIKTDIVSTDSSGDEDEDVELLAACISSGMKNISNEKQISRNSLQRIDSTKCSGNSSTTSPIPTANQRQISSKSSAKLSSLPLIARSAPDGQSSYLEKDSITVWATKGTGTGVAVKSKTGSNNELSTSAINGKSRQLSVQNRSPGQWPEEEGSEDEEILQKCIESGMKSANRGHNKSSNSQKLFKKSPKTPKTTPNASPNSVADGFGQKQGKNGSKMLNADQTKRFFVENTPVELSHCHSSLSSLSMESLDDQFEDQQLLNEMISRGMSQQMQKKSTKASKASKSSHMLSETQPKSTGFSDAIDDTTTYTICHKSERLVTKCETKKLTDSLMTASIITDNSCISDLDQMKPPSLMDNSAMFSSTESFSYRQIAPKQPVVHKNRDDSQCLLDNVKPPSLMEDLSMSQSCADSITSDISDIAFDNEVKTNEKIAEMAKHCAIRIQSMTNYSADNSDSDTIDRICRKPRMTSNRTFNLKKINSKAITKTELDYDLSDTEISEELPIDNESEYLGKTLSENNICGDFDSTSGSAPTQLPLESPTICVDTISDFRCGLEGEVTENRFNKTENQMLLSERRHSPIGSEDVLADDDRSSVVSDDSDPDSRATYNVNSPVRSRPTIVKPVIRKNKSQKEGFLKAITAAQPSVMRTSRAQIVKQHQHSHNNNNSKYVAKPTRTSALRASRSRSADEDFNFGAIGAMTALPVREKSTERHSYSIHRSKYIDYMAPEEPTSDHLFNKDNSDIRKDKKLQKNDSKLNSNSSITKYKEKSGFVSNMRSKLTASLSAHSLGASNVSLSSTNSSNGVTPSCASFSRKLEVQSRIASLWKRSKSTSNEKSDKQSKQSDLSRSISARRSFGKSSKTCEQQNPITLLRSSTFEKLPQSADEANQIITDGSGISGIPVGTGSNKKNTNSNDKYNNNYYIEKHETTVKSRQLQQNSDKTNGNSVYLLQKQTSKPTKQSKNSNNCIVLNKNILNEKLSTNTDRHESSGTTAPVASSAKPSSKSRRTCLVTAV